MADGDTPGRTSLFLRNFVFTVLHPGLVTVLIPWYLLREEPNILATPLQPHAYAGLAVMSTGLAVLLRCILQFALEGKGTLSPIDPTKRLVVRGLYRFSRNPMYMGVMIILTGEAILSQSTALWLYATIIFIIFNLFILLHEEPRLRRDFGEEYITYCRKVRRWI